MSFSLVPRRTKQVAARRMKDTASRTPPKATQPCTLQPPRVRNRNESEERPLSSLLLCGVAYNRISPHTLSATRTPISITDAAGPPGARAGITEASAICKPFIALRH